MPAAKLAAKYVLENEVLKAEVVTRTFSVSVTDKKAGQVWRMSDEPFEEVIVERAGKVTKETLAGSQGTVARPLGQRGVLFEFPALRLRLLLTLEENRLSFELVPGEENERFQIHGASYPRAFKLSQDSACSLVVPFSQGLMLPGDWPEEVVFGNLWPFNDEKRMRTFAELFGMNVEWWTSRGPGYAPALESDMLMPWWGAVEKKGSVLAVLDEDSWADSFLKLDHPAGGPTGWNLLWLPTKGRLGYPRRVSFHFMKGGYVALAKAYRKLADSQGKGVTLAAKKEANPKLERLVGAAHTRIGFMRHSHQRYEHAVQHTFAEGADLIAQFRKKTGIEKVHVVAWSWQQRGHDIQYPDLVPPSPECGGPVEFDKLASRVQELGYAFGLGGDNYHDVALDSPLFDESMLLRFADGTVNRRNFWASGLTSMICISLALKYLRRNFEVGRTDYPSTRGLLETAHPDTYFLGNFISSYECYDPRHPMTRNTCWDAQREIFQYINDQGLLLHNEHPKDWAVPYFFMARTSQARKGVYGYNRSGEVIGVPVPLWSLVWHDSLVTGGDNFLLQLLNGAPPAISLEAVEDAKAVERTKLHARLQGAVMMDEMVDHRFASADRTVEESEFSSGVSVRIDRAEGTFRICGVPGIREEDQPAGEEGRSYW